MFEENNLSCAAFVLLTSFSHHDIMFEAQEFRFNQLLSNKITEMYYMHMSSFTSNLFNNYGSCL